MRKKLHAERAAFSLVEGAYREAGSDSSWLEALLQDAAGLLDGGAVIATASTFRTDVPEGIRLIDYAGPADALVALQRCLHEVTAEVRRATFAAGPVIRLSDRIPTGDVAWEILEQVGVVEIVGFVCRDPGPIGCNVAFNLARRLTLMPQERRRLTRASAHVSTAMRLRLRKGPQEAVLAADGRLLDASGPARSTKGREALRLAARNLDRAKARAARDPEGALDAWRALVDGRWSLVERFESDGRRFYIALENEPPLIAGRRLTPIERRVVGYLVVGHSQKLIAYELGISESAISIHAASARRKLGVTTRAELMQLHDFLSARAPTS